MLRMATTAGRVVTRSATLQFQREQREQLDAVRGDQVVLLDPQTALQLWRIQTRLDGENFPYLEVIIPMGVYIRHFVRKQSDAVPQMVRELP